MSELSPRVKYAQWFFSGLAVGALGLMLVVNPMFKSTFKSVETIQSVDQRRIASQQSAITQLQGEAKERTTEAFVAEKRHHRLQEVRLVGKSPGIARGKFSYFLR